MFHINGTPHICGAFWSCLFIYGADEVLHFPLFPVRNNGGLSICGRIFAWTCFQLFLGIVFLAHVVAIFVCEALPDCVFTQQSHDFTSPPGGCEASNSTSLLIPTAPSPSAETSY